jgi:protein TonB
MKAIVISFFLMCSSVVMCQTNDSVLNPPGGEPTSLTISPETVPDENQIYNLSSAEVKPDFPGGLAQFLKFIGANFKMPDVPGLRGKVFVTFIVEKDGSLSDMQILRDIGYGTGEEAIRVLKLSPKWQPATLNGKNMRVKYNLPITVQSTE